MNTHVNFETAQLAKEEGFNIPVNTLFQHNKNLYEVLPSDDYPHLAHYGKQLDDYTTGYYDWNSLELDEEEKLHKVSGFSESDEDYFTVCCSAPTQSLLQKWLREKHEIIVWAEPFNSPYICYEPQVLSDKIEEDWKTDDVEDTYEEALEIALQNGLKLIKT